MKRKGFTLIELIAVIVILGLIMLIAVPSVSGQIIMARKGAYSNDIKAYMETVLGEYESKNYGYYLEDSELLIVPISRVKIEKGGAKQSPFGKYVQNDSYIVIQKSRTSHESYAYIRDTSGYGVSGKAYEEVNRNVIDKQPSDSIIGLESYYKCEDGRIVLNRGVPYNFKDTEYYACKEESIIDCTSTTIPIIRMCQESVCSITYNLDGGTLESGNPTVYDDSTKDFILNEPTKEGYIFLGWTGSNGDVPQHNVIIGAETSCHKIYRANWQLASEVTTTHVLNIQYYGPSTSTVWCGDSSSQYKMDSSRYVTANGSRTIQSYSYGDSGIKLLDVHNKDEVCFERNFYVAHNWNAYLIGDTAVSLNSRYSAVQLANFAGCDLATRDCTILAKANWSKTRVRTRYNCNGGKVVQLPAGNTEVPANLIGATGNPCCKGEKCAISQAYDFDSDILSELGVRNHNYLRGPGVLPIQKSGCQPTDYYRIGRANSPYKLNENKTFATNKIYVEWISNNSDMDYYSELKHNDVIVDLYADFSC